MPPSLSCLSSMATRLMLADVASAYARKTGIPVTVEAVGGVVAAERVRAGERVDIVVLAAPVMAALEAEGRLAAGSRVDVALSPMAAAVPSGRPLPGLSDGASVRRLIESAGRIGYSTGPSGEHLKRLLRDWGLAETLAERLVQAPPGVPVGTLLARGEADVGLQQLSELKGVDGIAVAGQLPAELGTDTIFTAGLAAAGAEAEAARGFLAFMISHEAEALLRHRGLEPARRA